MTKAEAETASEALLTCRDAGAVNAANALSNHITRLTIELDLSEKAQSCTTNAAPNAPM